MSGGPVPPASAPAPVLVLAVGNPSRGDDALGPELAARAEAAGWPHVEVVTEFQLQIENAVDLEGRRRVVFVDAGIGTVAPCELRRLDVADPCQHQRTPSRTVELLYSTHALSPQAVLEAYRRYAGVEPPESWVLCVRGERFELGEALSETAARNLEIAWQRLASFVAGEDLAA